MRLDAIALLGCRIEGGRATSGAARRRVYAAAHAFRAGRAPLVIVSGGRRWNGVSEAEAMMAELACAGVPEQALIPELTSLSTAENARNVARLLSRLGLSGVGLVTCDWHLPRAVAAFRRAGVRVEPIAAPSPPADWARVAQRSLGERVSGLLDRLTVSAWSNP